MYYSVNFRGGETAGSAAKKPLTPTPQKETETNPISVFSEPPKTDVVSFRGDDKIEEKSSSIGKTLLGALALTAIAIGGLGCAHKYDIVGKLKDGKFKDFMRKSDVVTEPCHKLCAKTKDYAKKGYETVKGWFNKK